MDGATESISCGECRGWIDEAARAAPCPQCGSLARCFNVSIVESVTVRERYGMKLKRPGIRRPVWESVNGAEFHRDTARWHHVVRDIGREDDTYEELITDPETGEVIRHCKEPLSKHIGRGDAKPKRGR